jgi:hypothetical protein
MKIKVKHKQTEFIIEDNCEREDTKYNLIYSNQDYILKMIKEITEHILKLTNDTTN